jgi:CheY-like chemotaxis protein
LLKLVNDLLDLAKIEAGRLELSLGYVDLQELIEHVTSLARVRAANAGLTLEVGVRSETFSPVIADERALRQVLLNLLGNAVKFTEPGGRVGLRAEGSRSAADRQVVRFVVEDTGLGIEEGELARIFEPFHRVSTRNRPVEGTGLGLTITQRLVAALNGRLTVVSKKGVGSTFTVECEFPIAHASQIAAFSPAKIVGYAGKAKRVLVADDDEGNRILVSRLLEGVGFQVEAVNNGREALDRINESVPDLVLTDLVMPEVEGMELVRQLQADAALRRIPVIAMSASASDYTREEALQAGCSGFVCKPLKLADLLDIIGERLQLQWQHGVAVPDSPPRSRSKLSQSFRLDPDLAADLQHLAMQGDIIGLTERIEVTLATDSSAEDFCSQVRELASRYDLRGIRQLLAASRHE